jgi:hypothetical protein
MPATTTKEFVIVLENRPGTLAEVGTALGKANINIRGFLLQAGADFGVLRLATSDPTKTESWLRTTKYAFRTRDLVTVTAQDTPGEVGRLSQKLAASGVNIEAAYETRGQGTETLIGFSVDDVPAAVKALS